jgi:hypothetical protein
MRISLICAGFASIMVSRTALAQPSAAAGAPAPRGTATSRATTSVVEVVENNAFTERRDERDGSFVVFRDDLATGNVLDGAGLRVLATPRVLRAGLLRPRVDFIPQLLASVENL